MLVRGNICGIESLSNIEIRHSVFDPAITARIDPDLQHYHKQSFSASTTVDMAAAVSAPLFSRLAVPSIFPSARLSFQQFTQKLFPTLAIAIPGLSINLPTLDDIWESVLRAVPKNKVSHSKKRHRQMAGKALKDVNHLCRCPGCGEIKRTHRLCQTCLERMDCPRIIHIYDEKLTIQ